MLRIIVTERGGPVRRLEFDKKEITIGRVQGNDIILPKGNVSKRHARITADEDRLVLQDLKSTNGTYVNGRRISEPHVLRPTDKIYIGDFIIASEDGAILVTAQRGSGEVQASAPVSLEDPAADLARRSREALRAEAQQQQPEEAPPAEQPNRPRTRPPSPPPAELEQSEAPRPASAAAMDDIETPRPSEPGRAAPAPAAVPVAAPSAAGMSPQERRHALAEVRRRVAKRMDLGNAGIFGDELRHRVAESAREVIAAAVSERALPYAVDSEALQKELVAEVTGLGPLEGLLADDSVTEILVNGPSEIFFERQGATQRHHGAFSSSEALTEVVRRLVARVGQTLPEETPILEVRLDDGSRLTAVLPPFAPGGPSLALRKVVRQSRTLQELVSTGALSDAMARFCDLCVRARRNVVITGEAGAGKTGFLGALAQKLPADERAVLVQELSEVLLEQENAVTLEAHLAAQEGRKANNRDLVRAALRLRPDRLVVGDCRGPEALDLLQAMAGGRDGVVFCVQAHSPREALSHLEALALLAPEAPQRQGVREAVSQACNIVIQVGRYPDGQRRVAQIAEVGGIENDRLVLQELFSYVPDGTGRFVASGYVPRFVDDLTRRGVAVELSIFRE